MKTDCTVTIGPRGKCPKRVLYDVNVTGVLGKRGYYLWGNRHSRELRSIGFGWVRVFLRILGSDEMVSWA